MAERIREIDNKENGLIALAIAILIFVIIGFGYIVHVNNSVEGLENAAMEACRLSVLNASCNDYQPCTLDISTPVHCNLGAGCASFKCSYIELSNGSCCNQQDSCYYDDPAKACVFGTCKSANAALCKGHCLSDNDCLVPLPLTLDPSAEVFTSCIYESCTTQFIIDQQVPDPMSLLDINTGNVTNLNISSCLDAICVNDFIGGISTCLYQWACAPFIGILNTKKRVIEQGSNMSSILRFPLKRLFGPSYEEVNRLIVDRVVNYKAIIDAAP